MPGLGAPPLPQGASAAIPSARGAPAGRTWERRRSRGEIPLAAPSSGPAGAGVGVGRGFVGEEDLGVGLLGVEERGVVRELVEELVDVLLRKHP